MSSKVNIENSLRQFIREEIKIMLSDNMYFKMGNLNQLTFKVKKQPKRPSIKLDFNDLLGDISSDEDISSDDDLSTIRDNDIQITSPVVETEGYTLNSCIVL